MDHLAGTSAVRCSAPKSWITANSWPAYLQDIYTRFWLTQKGKPKWAIDPPSSFSDLVRLTNEHEGDVPVWFQIPQAMAFPELVGYTWRHKYFEEYIDLATRIWRDQLLFQRIIRSSILTKKRPLCAPDFFFYTNSDKKFELLRLFNNRRRIPGRWNMWIQTKKPKDHVDWPPFVEYVRQLHTGEFLFIPNDWSDQAKGDEKWCWDATSFARSVVEIHKYTEKIPVRREIVDFVTSLGHSIALPRRMPLRKWSREDLALIRQAAREYWTTWRDEAESKIRPNY